MPELNRIYPVRLATAERKSLRLAPSSILAGVMMLCGGATANAALVSRNVNVTLNAATLDSYNLDVNLDGTNDFTFQAAYVPDPVLTVGFDQITIPFGSANGEVIDQQTGDGFPPVSLLKDGKSVSSSSLYSSINDTGDLFYDDTLDPTTGNFGGQTGFVGLRFTGAGGTFYGFAQITVDDLNSSSTPLNLTIGQVVYNDVAGQPAPIPEPISAATLASVSLIALAGRRRQRWH